MYHLYICIYLQVGGPFSGHNWATQNDFRQDIRPFFFCTPDSAKTHSNVLQHAHSQLYSHFVHYIQYFLVDLLLFVSLGPSSDSVSLIPSWEWNRGWRLRLQEVVLLLWSSINARFSMCQQSSTQYTYSLGHLGRTMRV